MYPLPGGSRFLKKSCDVKLLQTAILRAILGKFQALSPLRLRTALSLFQIHIITTSFLYIFLHRLGFLDYAELQVTR